MSNTWKCSRLASIVVATALVSGGCAGSEKRSDHRIRAAQEIVEMRGMSKEAADLARSETRLWLTEQEIMRRERETVVPRLAPPALTPEPVAQPEGQPVAEHATPASAPGHAAQMALVLQPVAAN